MRGHFAAMCLKAMIYFLMAQSKIAPAQDHGSENVLAKRGETTIEIAYGETNSGSISGSVDTFSFAAASGDQIYAYMGVVSGSLDPEIKLFGPDGMLIAENYSFPNELVRLWERAETNGVYTLQAGDRGNNNNGDYELFVTRLNKPPNTLEIGYGQTYAGEIGNDVDIYSFQANAGDRIHVYMGVVSGDLEPQIYLIPPDGENIVRDYDIHYGLAQFQATAQVAGTYAILANDADSSNHGHYKIHLTRLNEPLNEKTVQLGQIHLGTIDHSIDTLSFYAETGDRVHVYMGKKSGNLRPKIDLYSPTGDQPFPDRAGVLIENSDICVNSCFLL